MGVPRRPMPEGFEEMARTGASISKLSIEFQADFKTAGKWLDRLGIERKKAHRMKVLPADFHIYGGTEKIVQLRERYSTSEATILRWRRETGVKIETNRNGSEPLPIDPRFYELAEKMTSADLAMTLGRSDTTIAKWRKETGLHRKVAPKQKRNPFQKHQTRKFHHVGPTAWYTAAKGGWSDADSAADHLRLHGPWRGISRVSTSQPNAPRNMWWLGTAKVTEGELFEKAHKYGWRPLSLPVAA